MASNRCARGRSPFFPPLLACENKKEIKRQHVHGIKNNILNPAGGRFASGVASERSSVGERWFGGGVGSRVSSCSCTGAYEHFGCTLQIVLPSSICAKSASISTHGLYTFSQSGALAVTTGCQAVHELLASSCGCCWC